MTNDVTYSNDIRDMVIANLDGWQVKDIPEPEVDVVETETENDTVVEESNDIEPFMTTTEVQGKANKIITDTECRLFYEEALDLAYMHTNRLNIDDLTSVEARVFIRGVCKWAASNLWNKYNIRVNNEDMEDTYVQSYGGLLYKSALNILKQFINQRIMGLTGDTDSDDSDVWLV